MELDSYSIVDSIKEYLENKDKITLLQIGANDGVFNDPVHEIICKNEKIFAYLVEPQAEAFRRLSENYKNQKRVTCIKNAIYEDNRKIKLYKNTIGNDAHSSLLLRAEDPGAAFFDESVFEEVDAITIKNLFNDNNIDELNVLIIDTEGYDCSIIKQMFDTTSLRPQIIFFEKPFLKDNQDRNNLIQTGVATLLDIIKVLNLEGYNTKELYGNIIATKAY